jgi:hypothetical protein
MIKSRRMRWAGHVAHIKMESSEYKILMGKPGGKRLLRRPRLIWEDIVDGCGGMDWINLAQDRDQWKSLVNTVTFFRG